MAGWSTGIIEAEDTWYRYGDLSGGIDLIGAWVFFFFGGIAFNLDLVQGNEQTERSFKLILQWGKNRFVGIFVETLELFQISFT